MGVCPRDAPRRPHTRTAPPNAAPRIGLTTGAALHRYIAQITKKIGKRTDKRTAFTVMFHDGGMDFYLNANVSKEQMDRYLTHEDVKILSLKK